MTIKKIGEYEGYVRYLMGIMKNSGLPKSGNGNGNGVAKVLALKGMTIKMSREEEAQQQCYSSKCGAVNCGHKFFEQQLNYDINGKCIHAYK